MRGSARIWKRKGLGTSDPTDAEKMTKVVALLTKRSCWAVLDLIVADKPSLTLSQLWDYWCAAPKQLSARTGKLQEPSEDARLEYVLARISAVDLDDKLQDWADSGAKVRYIAQCRKFIPKGVRFALEDFNRPAISKYLKTMKVCLKTRKRHKTALAQFADYLEDLGLLTVGNPVRGIKLGKIEEEYPVFHEPETAKMFILAMPDGELKAMSALMHGTGMEWSAVQRLHVRDIDTGLRMALANGKKNKFRTRWVEVTEDWCWDIIERYVRHMTPAAKFVTQSWKVFAKAHKALAAELELPETSNVFHSWRHTFTAMWIDRGALGGLRPDGRNENWLKNQLGHSARSNKIRDTYGVRIHKFVMSSAQEERLRFTVATNNAAVPEQGTTQPARPALVAM